MKKKIVDIFRTSAVLAAFCFPLLAFGQAGSLPESASSRFAESPAPPVSSFTGLPDAPVADSTPIGRTGANQTGARFAPKYADVIEPEYQAQRLGLGGKLVFATTQLISPRYTVGALIAAGFSQGTDSEPKYGQDGEAFAQRLGAAAARAGSQIVFSHAILAPLLREDIRYYVLGSGHRVLPRIFYAASRVAIARTDDGHRTLNIAELAGYGGGAALTQFYYPKSGRNVDAIFEGYAASLGGLAILKEVDEFTRFLARHQPR